MKKLIFLLFLLFLSSSNSFAQTDDAILNATKVQQHIGSKIDLNTSFTTSAGKQVKLKSLIKDRPVIFMPVYYECPMLCPLVMNGFLDGVNKLKLSIGKDYDVITFSIDENETPEMAKVKKDHYTKKYHLGKKINGWHFLTGNKESIEKLSSDLGFGFAYDQNRDEYAHSAALIVSDTIGKISHYFTGINFAPKDLRLAIVESSEGKVGNILDQIFLFCFHYNPAIGKYTLMVNNTLRFFGTLTAGIIALFILISLRKERSIVKAAVS